MGLLAFLKSLVRGKPSAKQQPRPATKSEVKSFRPDWRVQDWQRLEAETAAAKMLHQQLVQCIEVSQQELQEMRAAGYDGRSEAPQYNESLIQLLVPKATAWQQHQQHLAQRTAELKQQILAC